MSKFVQYIKESNQELVEKTTWPTLSELQTNTLAVAVASILFAILIALIDLMFNNVLNMVFGLFK